MKGNRRHFDFLFLFLAVTPFVFIACGGRYMGLENDPFHLKDSGISPLPQNEAEEVFQRISTVNLELKTVKGKGHVKLKTGKENFSSRLFWAADQSGKMRLELIGPDGRPLLSFSTNGSFVYFYSHGEKKFYKKRSTAKTLGDYLEIPLEPDEMTGMLSGRIPEVAWDQIALTENQADKGFVLHLLEKKSGKTTRIFLDAERQSVRKMESVKSDGAIVYAAFFDRPEKVNGFTLPFHLLIEDGKGASFQLEMDRVWINPAIEDKLFILSEPES